MSALPLMYSWHRNTKEDSPWHTVSIRRKMQSTLRASILVVGATIFGCGIDRQNSGPDGNKPDGVGRIGFISPFCVCVCIYVLYAHVHEQEGTCAYL